jgi:hypothetical protein
MIAVTILAGTSLLVWRERLEADELSLRALGDEKVNLHFECTGRLLFQIALK